MKKYFLSLFICIITILDVLGQTERGSCGNDILWSFDGKTLTISRNPKSLGFVTMKNYDRESDVAPWIEKKLAVKSVFVEDGIIRIGSCAFANCKELTEVVFASNTLKEIGWGAFYNCTRLRTISIPTRLSKVERGAFANCSAITFVKIPDQCRVEDQAFLNCTALHSIEISPTALLGQYVFAREVIVNDTTWHALYNREILRLPTYINEGNSRTFGIARPAVERYRGKSENAVVGIDYDYVTSEVDSIVPIAPYTRNDTYALVIGNQNYRFVPSVPYAIHDARVFRKYCEDAIGIPVEHIHICEDATREMIWGEEMEWLKSIPNREACKLIVYYAGHGVPDYSDKNKAYILPTDVRGSKPQRGIPLGDLYMSLGELSFAQTTVFLDACFSGLTRDDKGVSEKERLGVIASETGSSLTSGNLIVFSATQKEETAQGYPKEGHGLFTYYLLKEIQTNYISLNLGSMSDNIKKNVVETSPSLELRKSQTPTTNPSKALADKWRSLSL